MAVRVDELTSDVALEPASSTGPRGEQPPPWTALAQLRALRRKAEEDAMRTRAEDFDD
jgi:hypothetical protein